MEKTERIFLQAVSLGLKHEIMEDPGLTKEEWEEILRLSIRQSLLAIVFESVYPCLPEDLERQYRAFTISWISRQVQATDEFLRTYQALEERGLKPLVFKGIVCRNAYKLPDWRVSGDEDIYVEPEEYLRLHAALKELGFEGRDPNFRSEHETIYHGKKLTIEGHWNLFPHENRLWEQMNAMTKDIMGRAVSMETEGVRILAPEPTDHMIYLLLHAMKHFSLAGVGIRQICDIAVWSGKYPVAWDRVRDTMDSVGGLKFAQAVVDAASRYFGMSMPSGWERRDSEHLIRDALDGGIFGSSSNDRLHSAPITSVDGITGHRPALNVLRAVFPARKVMEINYPWVSRSPLLLPAGWAVRLFQYARGIGKDSSPIRSIRIGSERIKLLEEYGVFRSDGREKRR